jgi:hypothetical protein
MIGCVYELTNGSSTMYRVEGYSEDEVKGYIENNS